MYSRSSSRDTEIGEAVTPLSCYKYWNNTFKNNIELWTKIPANTIPHLHKITFLILYIPAYAAEIYGNIKGLMIVTACDLLGMLSE